ncbi:hypothetical protein [Rossellomorea marisflavi]|uniref:hypothetical protein n=1 Tax=Rossellomorea marisflavi TaxID=189381 RepID=UPI00064F79B3|nr:hypothetical protein [Rossellomorea marisflavi]KML07881.1 hypothetical protein VL06_03190 [Rossellomorea marisflavi]
MIQHLLELQASLGYSVFRQDLFVGVDEVEPVRVVCTTYHVIEEILRVAGVPVVRVKGENDGLLEKILLLFITDMTWSGKQNAIKIKSIHFDYE